MINPAVTGLPSNRQQCDLDDPGFQYKGWARCPEYESKKFKVAPNKMSADTGLGETSGAKKIERNL